MRAVILLILITALADPSITVPAQMRLKDGTIYDLKAPPHLKDGRFVFTTSQGDVFSLAEGEVEEIHLQSPAPAALAAPNPQDSRALGAIARQHRRKTGKYVLIAPAPTPRPKTKARP